MIHVAAERLAVLRTDDFPVQAPHDFHKLMMPEPKGRIREVYQERRRPPLPPLEYFND